MLCNAKHKPQLIPESQSVLRKSYLSRHTGAKSEHRRCGRAGGNSRARSGKPAGASAAPLQLEIHVPASWESACCCSPDPGTGHVAWDGHTTRGSLVFPESAGHCIDAEAKHGAAVQQTLSAS